MYLDGIGEEVDGCAMLLVKVLEGGHGTQGLGRLLVGGVEVLCQHGELHRLLQVPQGRGVQIHPCNHIISVAKIGGEEGERWI